MSVSSPVLIADFLKTKESPDAIVCECCDQHTNGDHWDDDLEEEEDVEGGCGLGRLNPLGRFCVWVYTRALASAIVVLIDALFGWLVSQKEDLHEGRYEQEEEKSAQLQHGAQVADASPTESPGPEENNHGFAMLL